MSALKIAVTIEWVISHHARERAYRRHGAEFDPGRFRPQNRGRDGLRLWVDAQGNGALVREDSGTRWQRCTVVTALSPQQIDRALHDPLGPSFRAFDAFERVTTEAHPGELSEALCAVLSAIAERGPASIKDVKKRLRIEHSALCDALSTLAAQGRIRRASKRKWEAAY